MIKIHWAGIDGESYKRVWGYLSDADYGSNWPFTVTVFWGLKNGGLHFQERDYNSEFRKIVHQKTRKYSITAAEIDTMVQTEYEKSKSYIGLRVSVVDVKSLIVVRWVGVRKDSGRGSVWGYFTMAGARDHPLNSWENYDGKPHPACYVFRGKIGKSLIIEETELTIEFLNSVSVKEKNFKAQDSAKMLSRWGDTLTTELEQFVMFLRLKG